MGVVDGLRGGARRLGFGRPDSLRRLLERLGPTFVKLGQHLALRPDLVSQEACDELLGLVDQVAPMPWSTVESILREELGQPPEQAFAWVNPRPVDGYCVV